MIFPFIDKCKAFPFRRQCFGLKRVGLLVIFALEKNLPNGLCIIPHPPSCQLSGKENCSETNIKSKNWLHASAVVTLIWLLYNNKQYHFKRRGKRSSEEI